MTTGDNQLHVVFLPFLTPSHMTPLVHVARLFAARGVRSTVITTVHNALLLKPSVDQSIAAGHPISVSTVNFPASEVGLPVGIENFPAGISLDVGAKVFLGAMLLQNPIQQLIHDLSPDCIFSDMFFPWTVELAEELGIPRLLFYANGFLYHSVVHSLKVYAPHDHLKSESESFLVPNLPTQIEMKRSQIEEYVKMKTGFGEIMDTIERSEMKSFGLVHDTFYELEPAYADHFKKIKNTKVWHIGPLFQYFTGMNSSGNGGSSTAEEKHSCLSWLDSQKPNSVIFISFGSMAYFPEAQLIEIATALQESSQPFVWVVKNARENRKWLPEGFEEEKKGLILTGWVPQVKILEHPAVGGFMTHCGWNSTLEAIVAGLPLITWPLFAEQFYNEKFVELLGVGVSVGSEVWNPSFEITSPVLEKDQILRAIQDLMNPTSGKAETIRRKSKEMAIKAKEAVQPDGSSYNELTALIEEIKTLKFAKTH